MYQCLSVIHGKVIKKAEQYHSSVFEARTKHIVAIWPIEHPHEIKSGNKGEGQVAFLVMCEVKSFCRPSSLLFCGI